MKNFLLKSDGLIEKRELFFLTLNMFLFKTFSNGPEFFLSNFGESALFHTLFGAFFAIAFAALLSFIFEKLGNENLLDFKVGIGGSVLFLIIKGIFLLYLFLSAALGLYQAANLAAFLSFENSPFIFSALFFLIAAYIAQNAGIKPLAKTAEILLPLSASILILILFCSLKEAKITNIFPIFKTGESFSFLSVLNEVVYYIDFVVILLLNPSIKKDKNFKKTFFSAAFFGVLISFSAVAFLALTLPRAELSSIANPIFQMVKSVSFGRFMQRLDTLFLLAFAFSAMIYLSFLTSVISKVINPDLRGGKKKLSSFIITMAVFLLALFEKRFSPSQLPALLSLLTAFMALYILFAALLKLKKKG